MTNGDKIRQMSDEELAAMFDRMIQDCECCFLHDDCSYNTDVPWDVCNVMWLNWLREEVGTDE